MQTTTLPASASACAAAVSTAASHVVAMITVSAPAASALVPGRSVATRSPHFSRRASTTAALFAASREPAMTSSPSLASLATSPLPAGPVAPSTPISMRRSMARAPHGARLRGLRSSMADPVERPRTPLSVKLIGLAVVVIVAWVVLLPLFNIAASLLALALYVIVAFVAYQVGKAVGRSST